MLCQSRLNRNCQFWHKLIPRNWMLCDNVKGWEKDLGCKIVIFFTKFVSFKHGVNETKTSVVPKPKTCNREKYLIFTYTGGYSGHLLWKYVIILTGATTIEKCSGKNGSRVRRWPQPPKRGRKPHLRHPSQVQLLLVFVCSPVPTLCMCVCFLCGNEILMIYWCEHGKHGS